MLPTSRKRQRRYSAGHTDPFAKKTWAVSHKAVWVLQIWVCLASLVDGLTLHTAGSSKLSACYASKNMLLCVSVAVFNQTDIFCFKFQLFVEKFFLCNICHVVYDSCHIVVNQSM